MLVVYRIDLELVELTTLNTIEAHKFSLLRWFIGAWLLVSLVASDENIANLEPDEPVKFGLVAF